VAAKWNRSVLEESTICPPDLLDFELHLVGCGHLCAAVLIALARLGCPAIELWKRDPAHPDAEEPDLSALQPALAAVADEAPQCEIRHRTAFEPGDSFSGTVILCAPGMPVRRSVWRVVRYDLRVGLLTDLRLAGRGLQTINVTPADPDDVVFYEEHLRGRAPRPANAPLPEKVGALAALIVCRHAYGEAIPHEIPLELR
jgi:hypothetical protein